MISAGKTVELSSEWRGCGSKGAGLAERCSLPDTRALSSVISLTVETLVREPALKLSEVTEKSEGLESCDDTVEVAEGEIEAVDSAEKAELGSGGEAKVQPIGLLGLFQVASKRLDSSSVSGELPEDWVVTLENVRARARAEE